MIVRTVDGPFHLIRQSNQAILAGELAKEWGNTEFPAPQPREETLDGIRNLGMGWESGDDHPRLCPDRGKPMSFLDVPVSECVQAWRETVRRAETKSPFSRLLVSLHVSRMAEQAMDRAGKNHSELLRSFQEEQNALREHLRDQLALGQRGGQPAVGKNGSQITEPALEAAFRLLCTCDSMALFLCTDPDQSEAAESSLKSPSDGRDPLHIAWYNPLTLEVDPWPFRKEMFVVSVPAIEIPAKNYETDASLRAAFNVGRRISLRFAVQKKL